MFSRDLFFTISVYTSYEKICYFALQMDESLHYIYYISNSISLFERFHIHVHFIQNTKWNVAMTKVQYAFCHLSKEFPINVLTILEYQQSKKIKVIVTLKKHIHTYKNLVCLIF